MTKTQTDPSLKWKWMMDFCKTKGISPTDGWEMAEKAWREKEAPRTHAAWREAMKDAVDSAEPLRFMLNHSCQLEGELNVATANEAIAEIKAHILGKELKQANNRIKRLENHIETLEDCGDSLFNSLTRDEAMKRWKRAKEAKL